MAGLISAGRLDRRVTIEQPTSSVDSWGQPVEGWAAVASVWANIKPVSTREKMRAGALESEITHTVMVRWREAFAAPAAVDSWRITYGSRAFRVTGGHCPDEGREAFVFDCVETGL